MNRIELNAAAPEFDADETGEQRAERLDNITGFAGHLMPQLIGATQNNDMPWNDVVYAVGLALRAFAEVGAYMDGGGDAPTPQQTGAASATVQDILAKTMAVKVTAVKLDNPAELKAFMEQQESGLH